MENNREAKGSKEEWEGCDRKKGKWDYSEKVQAFLREKESVYFMIERYYDF